MGHFRQGLWHLMELSGKPIFIIYQSQKKQINQAIIQQLKHHQSRITTLTWGAHSMVRTSQCFVNCYTMCDFIFLSSLQTPSSGFWKSLALAMPRKVMFHCESAGDPQTLLQGDEDPMLTQQPDYLDCRPDPDLAGDLGNNRTYEPNEVIFIKWHDKNK